MRSMPPQQRPFMRLLKICNVLFLLFLASCRPPIAITSCICDLPRQKLRCVDANNIGFEMPFTDPRVDKAILIPSADFDTLLQWAKNHCK